MIEFLSASAGVLQTRHQSHVTGTLDLPCRIRVFRNGIDLGLFAPNVGERSFSINFEPILPHDQVEVFTEDGRPLINSPFTAPDRLSEIIDGIDLCSSRILEMGPLDRPLLSKAAATVSYVDHASRADLLKKYEGTGTAGTVSPAHIAEIDIVWDGVGPIVEVTDQRFDACISSHVIEHVPDIISWLQNIGSVLRPGSLINMAIPDKERTFDFYRQPTKPADLIATYLEKRTRPSPAQVFDHITNVVEFGSPRPPLDPHVVDEAYRHAWAVHHNPHYLDVHCSVFTQQSFLNCFETLAYCGLINLKLRKFFSTRAGANEFIVSMEYGDFPLPDMAESFAAARRTISPSNNLDHTASGDCLT